MMGNFRYQANYTLLNDNTQTIKLPNQDNAVIN